MTRRQPSRVRASQAILISGLLLLTTAQAEAFEGRVLDRQTGRAIAGAEVAIAGRAGTVRTSPAGDFAWSPDPPLPFTILVILPDGRLARPVRVMTLDAGLPLVVQVDPAVETALVIVGSAPSVEAPLATATTLVPAADIARRAPANLPQALESVTGVGGVADGQSAVPAIRGLARGRTLLLLDGARLFSERRAGPSVSFLSPAVLDRIDVVRGPASVAYGSDAFGGVISMITRRPAAGAPPAARIAATAGAGVPARRFEVDGGTGLGPLGGVVFAGRFRRAGDYTSPDGLVPNSAWRDRGGLVRGGVRARGWWTAGWQGDFTRDSGLPRSDSATLLVSTPFERSQRGSASFDHPAIRGVGALAVTGLFSRYAQRLDQDRLAAPGRPRRIDRADLDGTDIEVRAQLRRAVGRVRWTAGADVSDRRDFHAHDVALLFNAAGVATSTTDNASIVDARRRDTGVFAQADLPLSETITVTSGARFDRVRSRNVAGYFGDRSVAHGAASASASLAWRPAAPLTLALQVSRGFRDPTLSDRFFRGPVGRGFIVGNPDLAPERSRQIDVAGRYDAGRVRVDIAAYRYLFSDLIERYQSDADTFLFRNRGRAIIQGVEIEGHFDLPRGVTLVASAQTGRGRADDDDNGAPIDDIGPARVVLQLRQHLRGGLTLSLRAAAVARNASPGPSEVTTPGYLEAGATAGWRAARQIDLRVAASNLFNRRYYGSTSSRGVLVPGRAATATIVVTF